MKNKAAQSRQTLLGGSWFIPPTSVDWTNIEAAGVKRMMLDAELCHTHPAVLEELRNRGISILMRFSDDQFCAMPIGAMFPWIEEARNHAQIEGVIFFNEPTSGFDMGYDSTTTWANMPSEKYPGAGGKLQWYRHKCTDFIQVYASRYPLKLDWQGNHIGRSGPSLIAGAFPCLMPAPSVKPWPGLMTWNRVMYDVLAWCDKWCAHVYTENNKGPCDPERFEYITQVAFSMGQPPYIVDEINVLHKPEAEQVGAVIRYMRWLQSQEQQQPGHAGALCELVIPFTFNGDCRGGAAWPCSYLLTEPASYLALGDFIAHG